MFSIQELQCEDNLLRQFCNPSFDRDKIIKGAFVRDQSGIRIIGIMQVSVHLAALPIPEYLDFHSGYSAPRSRIAGIYSRISSYSRIFPNERAVSRRHKKESRVWCQRKS